MDLHRVDSWSRLLGSGWSRRGALKLLGGGLGLAALAVLPKHEAAAARLAKPAPRPTRASDEAGREGIELLRAWAAGELPRRRVPADWAVAVPPLGAGFFYPPAWEVTEITDPNRADLSDGDPFGVWVEAPDQSAAVLMLNTIANGPVSAGDAAWERLKQAIGETDLETLADDRYETGATVPHAFVAGRVDTTIVAVHVSTMPETTFGRTYLYVNLVAGNAEIFDAATDQVFLPLLQNLVTGGPGDCDRDPDDDEDETDDCSEAD